MSNEGKEALMMVLLRQRQQNDHCPTVDNNDMPCEGLMSSVRTWFAALLDDDALLLFLLKDKEEGGSARDGDDSGNDNKLGLSNPSPRGAAATARRKEVA